MAAPDRDRFTYQTTTPPVFKAVPAPSRSAEEEAKKRIQARYGVAKEVSGFRQQTKGDPKALKSLDTDIRAKAREMSKSGDPSLAESLGMPISEPQRGETYDASWLLQDLNTLTGPALDQRLKIIESVTELVGSRTQALRAGTPSAALRGAQPDGIGPKLDAAKPVMSGTNLETVSEVANDRLIDNEAQTLRKTERGRELINEYTAIVEKAVSQAGPESKIGDMLVGGHGQSPFKLELYNLSQEVPLTGAFKNALHLRTKDSKTLGAQAVLATALGQEVVQDIGDFAEAALALETEAIAMVEISQGLAATVDLGADIGIGIGLGGE